MFIYGKYLGGGPELAAFADKIKSGLSSGGGGSGASASLTGSGSSSSSVKFSSGKKASADSDRVGLLRPGGQANAAAASRLASLSKGSSYGAYGDA